MIYSSAGSGGGLVHLRGKSSSVFKYGCGEVGGVVKMSSRGARGEVGVAMRLFEGSRSGEDSLDETLIMLVRAIFFGGFLVEDETLEV
ncbi:hypothetical protein Tco_0285787 [Tanacetum coccineum]